jgi:hypothetical protein
MKPINAFLFSLLAGVTTFAAEHYLFPAPLHAAAFSVPKSSDWRQRMIDQDPGGAVVDRLLERLTTRLNLTDVQASRARPLIEEQHKRILAVLLTAPPSLTRDQFVAARQSIRAETRWRLEALLTPDQREITEHELAHPTG